MTERILTPKLKKLDAHLMAQGFSLLTGAFLYWKKEIPYDLAQKGPNPKKDFTVSVEEKPDGLFIVTLRAKEFCVSTTSIAAARVPDAIAHTGKEVAVRQKGTIPSTKEIEKARSFMLKKGYARMTAPTGLTCEVYSYSDMTGFERSRALIVTLTNALATVVTIHNMGRIEEQQVPAYALPIVLKEIHASF